jgi:N-carbamoyl-L-amino-acid hydrolase
LSGAPTIEPDVGLAERLFAKLRARTFDGVGVTRASYGEGEQAAHELVAEAGREIGLEVETDFAGNLYLTLPGRNRNEKRLVIGSPGSRCSPGSRPRGWRRPATSR